MGPVWTAPLNFENFSYFLDVSRLNIENLSYFLEVFPFIGRGNLSGPSLDGTT